VPAMAVTVIIRSGAKPADGRNAEAAPAITLDAPLIVVGRGESCDVRLPDPSVSHRHATIRQRANEYFLVDERSTNGTFVGAVKLGAEAPRLLRHGDLARLGRVWIEMRFDRPATSATSALATRELALLLVARALDAQGEAGGPRVVVSQGPDEGKALRVDESGRVYVIGRGHDVDLVLGDPDTSRRHVQIVRRAEQLLARDLASKNGTDLAGTRVPTDRDCPWRPGQLLRLGSSVLSYEHPALSALQELERGADECLRSDESIPGPDLAAPASSQQDASPAGERGPGRMGDAPTEPEFAPRDLGAAPIARVPQGNATGRVARKSKLGAWSGTDLLVILLALSVLVLSIVGLFWLFKV
jgi:pSer/pThr/pTyr-binding forkhead associated (FHA) protein